MLEGPSLDSFQEAYAVHQWWGSGERARRRGCLGDNQLTDAELEAELYAVAELYARLQH